ncbi:MAG: S41 family peptidase [Acidobacteriota bacterium]|nr:S41 family peptidase [Acidobacteriota bacterium]
MKRQSLFGWLILLMVGLAIFSPVNRAVEFSRSAWLQDYQVLKRFLEIGYANLDSAREVKKVDLVALDGKTKQALDRAASDGEAKNVLKQFLAAFDDLHLRLGEVDKPATQSAPAQAFAPTASSADVCKALGFRLRLNRFSLPFDKASGFQPVSTDKDLFATGLLRFESAKKFGVLRLALFSPDAFPKTCETGWEEFRQSLKADCDAECLSRFYSFVQKRLSDALRAQVKTLQAGNIDGLLVDIAGNGGGTEWADLVARMLAARPLKAPRQNGVRHERDVARFERQLQLIEADLQQRLSDEQQRLLKQAKERITAALAEAKTARPCERPDIWTSSGGGRQCTSLKTAQSFSSGALDYVPPGLLAGLKAKTVLFNPSQHDYQESVFAKPLLVLVDQKTASAAEYFAALLQDNEAAKIIGERTLGVGCGYTNGGIKWVLPNSKLRVFMPDCVRYRKNGGNEYEGITPDAAIWTKDDDKTGRLEKLLKFLRELR